MQHECPDTAARFHGVPHPGSAATIGATVNVVEAGGVESNNQSAGFWKVARSAQRGAAQLRRRQGWPDLPFIHGEIQTRMIERSQIMRPADGCVIDMSLGRADAALQLAQRFSDRAVHVVRWGDPLPATAPSSSALQQWSQKIGQPFGSVGKALARVFRAPAGSGPAEGHANAARLAGDIVLSDECSPLAPPSGPGSAALVWSNGLLHRLADPMPVLKGWHSALAPGGALFFSCFGPDTAKELAAVAAELELPFADFADMHDWGDLLIKTGFSDPVMEMERLVLTYRRVEDLLRDWHALGGNPAHPVQSGLRGRGFYKRLNNCLQKSGGGSLQISLEILYGHAWRVVREEKPREIRIPVSQIRRKP